MKPPRPGHRLSIAVTSLKAMLLSLLLIGGWSLPAAGARPDVVIYGATPAGISAAVSAAREGARVLLIEPSDHFGGMITGGMSNPDFKTYEAVNGFYRDFMQRVLAYYRKRYGEDAQQVRDCYGGTWYEPHVAGEILADMIAEYSTIEVLMSAPLMSVQFSEEDRRRIGSVRIFDNGLKQAREIAADIFIDATYEGDLMAEAGCAYEVGREGRARYGELFAGVKYYDDGKFLIGSSGEGDHKIQCYNFRICMTDSPSNRVPLPKPSRYDREAFLPLLALLKEGRIKRFNNELVAINRVPNGKADINDKLYSLYSLRLPGENYGWPDGDAAARKAIFEKHLDYTLSFFYFLQHDPEVPAAIRGEASAWGLPKDEFMQSGHFPPVLYVREGRRLRGEFVLTERDLLRTDRSVRSPLYTDAVAICDYSMDSHGNGPPTPMHPGITEGVFNYFVTPYQLPYRVMVPRETANLLVTCAVSASHVAFSSLRMEPTWCSLGQAAGVAAAMCAKGRTKDVAGIQVSTLQRKLYRQQAMTVYVSDVNPSSPYFEAVQYWGTRGFFHDLPEYADAPYRGRGAKGGLPGQFILKYPYHDIQPDKTLEHDLAEKWLALVKGEASATFRPGMTRGEFLLALYKDLP